MGLLFSGLFSKKNADILVNSAAKLTKLLIQPSTPFKVEIKASFNGKKYKLISLMI